MLCYDESVTVVGLYGRLGLLAMTAPYHYGAVACQWDSEISSKPQ